MKDNKYQEYMSHITMTPEMKERVLEAVEEEIEEEMALISEEGPEAKERMSNEAVETNLVMDPEKNENSDRERELSVRDSKAVKKGKEGRKKIPVFRYAGFAVAACLLLFIGAGLGAGFSGRNRFAGASDGSYTGKYYDQNSEDDPEDAENAAYEDEEIYDTGEESLFDEGNGMVPASESADASDGGGSVSAQANGQKEDQSGEEGGLTTEDTSGGGKSETKTDEKLVYTAHVTIETESYQDSIQSIRESIKKCDGFIESEYEYGDAAGFDYNSVREDEGDVSVCHNRLVIRIPMDKYDSFLNGMSAFGMVTEKSQDVDNITKSWQDTNTRIKALKTQEKRLLEMMEKTKTISEMIEVEDRLTEVQTELESYQNSLNEMDTKVRYGTIELALHQVKKVKPAGEAGFTEKMKENFQEGLDMLVRFFQGAVFLIAFLLPLVPVVAVIVVLVVWIRRKRKKKK